MLHVPAFFDADLDTLPVGLEVVHTPQRVHAQQKGRSGRAFTWTHATEVRARCDARMLAFGGFDWQDGAWHFRNVGRAAFGAAEFASWYACPDGRLRDGHRYGDLQNWAGADRLRAGRTRWIFVARADDGRLVKGDAVVEHLAALKPERVKATTVEHPEFRRLAESFRSTVREQAGVELGYDEAGVQWLDAYVARHRASFRDRPGLFNAAGSYFGECIRESYGGEWLPFESGDAWTIVFDGHNGAFPFNKLKKHAESADGESIHGLFVAIASMRQLWLGEQEPPPAAPEVAPRVDAPPPPLAGRATSADFHAQCYLAAWQAGLPIQNGLAHAERLRGFALDHSWASLHRVDDFLDDLRSTLRPSPQAFLGEPANTNLLYLLAFYVGELRSRKAGVPARWVDWAELQEIEPGMRMFGAGFHSSVAQVQPGCFLPLVSIVERLFEGPQGKSVAFSAGTGLKSGAAAAALTDNRPLPALPPQSLVADFPAGFKQVPTERRMAYLEPRWGRHFVLDPLDRQRKDLPLLLGTGRVVMAATVQANNRLIDGSIEIAPMDLLYDPNGRVPGEDLRLLARELFALKGQRTADAGLQPYADHLQDEQTRLFGWRTPPSWLPLPLLASTVVVDTAFLPVRRLAHPVVPILVSDACPGTVAVAPLELWPARLRERWIDAEAARGS